MIIPQLSGNTESTTALELIAYYTQNEATGTLWLEHGTETALILFNAGTLVKHYSLEETLDTDRDQVDFMFHQHSMQGHIELPSRFPTSLSAVMRALPKLSEQVIPTFASTDIQELLSQLEMETFTGYLRVEDDEQKGLIILKAGSIIIALYEAEQTMEEADDALRLIRRLALESTNAKIAVKTLAPTFLEGLIALHKNNASHGLHIFNGLESSESGYAFFKDGKALLRTSVELVGLAAYFPHLMEESEALQMPDEPLGWETKTYQLTLRGKDSLNAITELAMTFERSFGEEGKRILRFMKGQQTPASLAETLEMNLGDIKPMIDKLEQNGLIRRVKSSVEV